MLEYVISFQKMEIIFEYLNPQKSVEITSFCNHEMLKNFIQ